MSGGVHNSPVGLAGKLQMRRNVLADFAAAGVPSNVLDVFCGPVGEMYAGAWRQATSYVGVDRDWHWTDTRRRFIGDTMTICASIDLQPFNVFDIDAFGAPWPHLLLLAKRRTWAKGERGAIVTTDGTSLHSRFGGMSSGLRGFLGLKRWAPKAAEANVLHKAALDAWYRRSRVKPLRAWHCTSNGSGKGGAQMHYRAVIFEGTG